MSLGNIIILLTLCLGFRWSAFVSYSSVQYISRQDPSLSTPSLSGEAQFYPGMALSQNTTVLACNSFIPSALKWELHPPFPSMRISWSIFWCAWLVQSTITNYSTAIKHYRSSHGYVLNLSAFLRLQFILHGIKCSGGVNSKAITLHILNLFYHLLNVKYTTKQDSLMVWAADTCLFQLSPYWRTPPYNVRLSFHAQLFP